MLLTLSELTAISSTFRWRALEKLARLGTVSSTNLKKPKYMYSVGEIAGGPEHAMVRNQ